MKKLVVFYSLSGNTRAVARRIARALRADLLEIRTVKTYPDDYDVLLSLGEKEVKSGYIKIRLECVDGTIVMSAANTLQPELAQPYNSKGKCQGNFYFAEHMPNTSTFAIETAVTFTLN